MSVRTPEMIKSWLSKNQHRFDEPAQFYGTEPNAVNKDWDSSKVRWLMLASWVYAAAAGNSSVPAVYKAINIGREDFLCDRFYLPATPRDLRCFETAGMPVFGIESKHELRDFDVVGTSIAYPLLSMSFLKMLTMSGMPARWKEREVQGLENFPMVMVGGLSYGAPEVLAPVVDCWFCGEVEDEPGNPGIAAVTARIAVFKETGAWQSDRLSCYKDLALEFNYLYFPRFVDVHYEYQDRPLVDGDHPSKQVSGYSSNLEGMRLPITKRFVHDMDKIVPLDDPPLLFNDANMISGDIESGRGCPAWCSFCALTWRQKPARQRSVPYMVEYAQSLTENMGGTHLSPFSPDFAMQSNKKRLISALLMGVSDEVDSSSMRIDDFIADDDFILLQVTGGMRSVTLGLEGGSQRMRDLVGKGTRDEDVCEAVSRGIRAGVKRFKIYMITNLPGEDEGDIYRTLRLGKKLADIRESMGASNVRIQFSWTPLMVESNTPLQWFAVQETSRILGDVLEEFRNIKIEGKIGERARHEKLVLHQLCHRASRDVGEAIIDAFLLSNKACWGGVPRDMAELLEAALRARGFHNGTADCFDERDRNDLFGWEFISQGIDPDLMWSAYQQMREFAELTDSHDYDSQLPAGYGGNEWIARCDQQCLGNTCGVCSAEDLKLRAAYIRDGVLDDEVRLSEVRPVDERSQVLRVRARLVRPDSHRFVSNDHWRYNVRRAAYRAAKHLGLPGAVAKRSIRFASDSITYRDWTSGVDYLEFGLTSRLSVPQVDSLVQAMNEQMLSWMRITGFEVYPASAPPMRTEVDLSLFELELDEDSQVVEDAIEQWRESEYVKLVIKTEGSWFGNVPEEVNAKDYVDGWWLVRDGHRLRLRMLVRGKPNPYAVYAALMGKVSWLDAAEHVMTRLESFVTVDRNQLDFLRPACNGCGLLIPVTVLDVPYDPEWCPQCKDKNAEVSRGC